MWELDWSGGATSSGGSQVKHAMPVDAVAPLFWEEHCVECAPPVCFESCPLFVERADGICARFEAGIVPRRDAEPATSVSLVTDIRFRRWAKLVTDVPAGLVSPRWVRVASVVDRIAGAAVRGGVRILRSERARTRVLGAYAWRRRRRLRTAGRAERWRDAVLVVDVENLRTVPVELLVEYSNQGIGLFRRSWTLEPGANHYELPLAELRMAHGREGARLTVMPMGDDGAHLRFHALDVVVPSVATTEGTAAAFAKVVAWDLDNTVWAGTLAEATPDALVVDDRVVRAMRTLDERGILQTVVSKNDAEPALAVLARFGVDDLLVAPRISWGPKSDALRAIAATLNLGLDSFVLVDDSAFERAEVHAALPMVRVLDVDAIDGLLDRPELSPPVSTESRARRIRYQEEARRQDVLADAGTDYEAFVRSCDIRAEVFRPVGDEVTRCVELIQRSNQLNLSGRRLTRDELDGLADGGEEWLALRASDRFGDYGIVGVMGVDHDRDATIIRDLCISCRAANRMMEQAWFAWLSARDATPVIAALVESERNGPLRATLDASGFVRQGTSVVLPAGAVVPGAEFVTFVDRTAAPTASGAPPGSCRIP